MKIAWFATKGTGSNEAERMRALLSGLPGVVAWPFDRSAKRSSALALWRRAVKEKPDLIVVEGTGLAGGLLCLAARLLLGIPYVVSSGDAVGPFLRAALPGIGPAADLYERWLCRLCAGFVGWTPYLCGRALAFGAPRAVTAPGWVLGGEGGPSRQEWRQTWGVPPDAILVGILGSLVWNPRRPWCYGLDLVRAAKRLNRDDVCVVVVGDGTGLAPLRKEAGEALGRRAFLPGPVPFGQAVSALKAMDVGSLPQSSDAVGAYRYTTKLPEYLAAGLPVITNQIPVAYDLGEGWTWRLPGDAPWSPPYQAALEALLATLDHAALDQKRSRLPALPATFNREEQTARITSWICDLLARENRA